VKRSRPTADVEHDVLIACGRKCCLCYFLESDKRTRKGQIAHINQNRADSRAENLVWLCFDHHDEYDSTTRQSKGLTAGELRSYRDRLTALLGDENQGKAKADGAAAERAASEAASSAGTKRYPWKHAWRFPMWQVADQPELFAYSASAGDGICAIERIDLPDGRVAIACMAVPGNPGNSITNCAEYIFQQVCERFRIDPAVAVWLEHYDYYDPLEWRWVRFGADGGEGSLDAPEWVLMTADLWDELGLAPMKHGSAKRIGELRTKLKKRFPWPPSEYALGLS
jgi:hypothetical protein